MVEINLDWVTLSDDGSDGSLVLGGSKQIQLWLIDILVISAHYKDIGDEHEIDVVENHHGDSTRWFLYQLYKKISGNDKLSKQDKDRALKWLDKASNSLISLLLEAKDLKVDNNVVSNGDFWRVEVQDAFSAFYKIAKDILAQRVKGKTLHSAIIDRDHFAVKQLLEAGADVNLIHKHGYAPIHFAVIYSAHDILQMLIEAKANVNIQSDDGNTALHFGASNGDGQAVMMLLKAGADKNIRNNGDCTPSEIAKTFNKPYTAKLLTDWKQCIDAVERVGLERIR